MYDCCFSGCLFSHRNEIAVLLNVPVTVTMYCTVFKFGSVRRIFLNF
jgi:hypothetical protein